MSLTLPPRPLESSAPTETNYSIDGPRHRLLLTPFPRRVRAEVGGHTVLDTVDGGLLHESNLLPALYVPVTDVDTGVLVRTDHTTHCPFKGDASYWSIRVGDRTLDNVVWAYEHPLPEAGWLSGRMAFYFDRLDRWLDEDEEVFGHLRDPFHRVDVRESQRLVQVRIGATVVAESTSAKVLSETGLPNRWYLPRRDVRLDLLDPSSTSTHCPYKGRADYWNYTDAATAVTDVAWAYEEPFDDARRVGGHLCFDGDDVTIDVARR
jgi:uncharacterized protein (DUF427 family)